MACGQMMSVGVIGRGGGGGEGEGNKGETLKLTVQPKVLNQGLSVSDLRQGMYISGSVASVEDRGYPLITIMRKREIC